MKKRIALVLSSIMALSMFCGCSQKADTETTAAASTAAKSTEAAKVETTAASEKEPVDLVCYWWGNQVRNERTQNALDKYMELNPGVTVEGQFAEFADYWNKLATLAAGEAVPDVLQTNILYLDQYVKSNHLLDLTPYIEDGTLDVSDISENSLASGMVDGKVYAISGGTNAPSMFYNKTLLEEHEIALKDNMNMDEFIEVCRQVYEKAGVRTDLSYGNVNNFCEFFLRSYDYIAWGDKSISGSAENWVPFFELYEQGINEGWLLDPAVYSDITIGSIEQCPMIYGMSPETSSWCALFNSNQYTAAVNAAPEGMEVGITTWPAPEPQKSNYLKPALFFSVGIHSEKPEESVKLLDYLINSEEANDILLGERGIPAPADVATYIAPKLSEVDQEVIRFVNEVVTPNCSPLNPPQPDGANEVYNLLNNTVEKVCYQVLTAEEAAVEFFEEANKIMAGK